MAKFKKKYDFSLLDGNVFTIDREINPKPGPIDWQAVFANDRALEVEIGCGNGHFMINQAQTRPGHNFIGIDLKSKRLIRCREKQLKDKIQNISWICGDAFLALDHFFKDKSISKMYMPFPDPWPKKRHHKHRLFKKDFTDIIFKKLIIEGQFTFITDHKEYYQAALQLIQADQRFVLVSKDFSEELTQSLFAIKWRKEQRQFYSFTIKKID